MCWLYFSLGRIFRDEIKSTVTYLKKMITIDLFSSNESQVSKVSSTILTSADKSVEMKIDIFPNRENQLENDYVIIHATLLSHKTHCYACSIKCSILTAGSLQAQETYQHFFWEDNTWKLLPIVLKQKSSSVNRSILDEDKLNINFDIFCMRTLEQISSQSVQPSTVNTVDMTCIWTICNLVNFPNVRTIRIVSTEFPSNSSLLKFHLQLAPRGITDQSLIGYSSLQNCVSSKAAELPLLINNSMAVKNYGESAETLTFSPQSTTYTSLNCCWGSYGIFLFQKALSKQCITLEYQGLYTI